MIYQIFFKYINKKHIQEAIYQPIFTNKLHLKYFLRLNSNCILHFAFCILHFVYCILTLYYAKKLTVCLVDAQICLRYNEKTKGRICLQKAPQKTLEPAKLQRKRPLTINTLTILAFLTQDKLERKVS